MSECYNSELPMGLPGPTGPQGLQGLQGLNGTVWLNGEGEPDPAIGLNNDYYLDTLTGELYIKEYVGLGLRWVVVTEIYGTPGTPGSNGTNGENGVALQWIPFGEGEFFKSLGISPWITPASVGIAESFYSSLFYFLGDDLCPVDNSVARITIFYETTGTYTGGEGTTPASVFYNFSITPDGGTTTLVNGGTIPSAFWNGTSISLIDSTTIFTKVCYTIRRKSINTAEILTEWSSSSEVDGSLFNASGNYYTPAFLTAGKINFAPSVYNEFKFQPFIVDSTPTSNPQSRALSFYIEKLR